MATLLSIAERFCGPPGTGNGGYVAGRLAAALGGAGAAPVEVTLRRPVPLARDLRVARDAASAGVAAQLLDPAGDCLAEARITGPDDGVLLPPPPPLPGRTEAEAASRRFAGFRRHSVGHCFVCGTGRAEGDGLRIFPGALRAAEGGPDGRIVAAPWTPDASLADEAGAIRPEFVWAALDCPGAFAVMPEDGGRRGAAPFLLGRITARLACAPLRASEPCTVLGWPLGAPEGRRHLAGTAVFGADGTLRGLARAVWFAPAPTAG